jgi:hypothetical protein
MNLKDIRKMIGSILDYDPEVDSYKAEVNAWLTKLSMT